MPIKTKTTIRVETHKYTIVRSLDEPLTPVSGDHVPELEPAIPVPTNVDEDPPQDRRGEKLGTTLRR